MQIEWSSNNRTSDANDNEKQIIHFVSNPEHFTTKELVEGCVEKATSLLHINIEDESLYFLIEWNQQDKQLSIVVTDDSKQKDSKELTQCKLTDDTQSCDELAENIQYWARDYLTTFDAFINYSLVALFHQDTRQKTRLL